MSNVTPGRRTVATLNTGGARLARPAWHLRRNADEIGRGVPPGAEPRSHVRPTGDAWILGWTSALTDFTFNQNSGLVLTPNMVNAAATLKQARMWRAPTDITGMGVSAAMLASGLDAWVKEVQAGASTESRLEQDELDFPGPEPDESQIIPLDRVLSATLTWAPNTSWALAFLRDSSWGGRDTFLRFYFGGGVGVTPVETSGGQYCVALNGDGSALLHERDEHTGGWEERLKFRWLDGDGSDSSFLHFLGIAPYGKDRIAFITNHHRGLRQRVKGSEARAAGTSVVTNLETTVYRDLPHATGHEHVRFATGAGGLRLDIRRDQMAPLVIGRGKYQSLGVLPDGAFRIPFPLPPESSIRLTPDFYVGENTGITWQMFSATTHQELYADGADGFLSLEGETDYYVVFTLSTEDGEQTPVLYGYDVEVGGVHEATDGANLVTPRGAVQGVQILGPDLSPEHEQGSVRLHDTRDQLSILRARGRIKARISVVDPIDGAVISHLLEGETQPSRARKRKSSSAPLWYEYSPLRMTGAWARLTRQVCLSAWDFRQDPYAPMDPNTGQRATLPWRVVDIVRLGLNQCGVPNEEIDLPNVEVRLHPSQRMDEDAYFMQPGLSWSALIQRLLKDYLGMTLVRDPNAGLNGMWRALWNPQPPFGAPIAEFVLNRSGSEVGKAATAEGTWGEARTFIRCDTWETWVVPPECNYVQVTTTGELLLDGSSRTGLSAEMWNPLSFNWPGLDTADPNHPDYLEEGFVPVFIVDPTLPTQRAVDFLCRRVYDFAAHAEKWFSFVAPLLLIWDPFDPYQVFRRPLRINDVVTVAGFPAVIRSCNPGYRSDRAQMAYYEGRFL